MRTLSTCWKRHWYLWNSPCLQPRATPDRASSSDKSGSENIGRGHLTWRSYLSSPGFIFVEIPGRRRRFHAPLIDSLHFNYRCARAEKVEDAPHGICIPPSLVIYFRQTLRIYYQALLPIILLIYSPPPPPLFFFFFPVNSH